MCLTAQAIENSLTLFCSPPLGLHLAWTAASFPFGVLMLPGAVRFVEVPLPTFFHFSFLQITHPIYFGHFSHSLEILFPFFSFKYMPLSNMWGSM
jgi:hypothetical protein